ncbi:MAG: PQQ-binding-like beta-propeller repeat protein, partial [bacterium]
MRYLLLVVLLSAGVGRAEWTRWHGEGFNGAGDAQRLADQWGPGTNVRWVAEMPGVSAATPIVSEGRVYVSVFEEKTATIGALCFSVAEGKELWRRDVAKGVKAQRPDSVAAASAVVGNGRVIFTFSSGDVAAFDTAGKLLWKCNLVTTYGELGNKFGYSSSPVLGDGRLFIQILRDNANPSLVVCLDAASGREVWKVERATSAKEENKDAYSTPCFVKDAGRTLLVVAGGDYITAHELKDGREVWRSKCYAEAGTKNFNRLIPSPTVCGDQVVLPVNRGSKLVAVKIGSGDWSWTLPKVSSDVSTPLFYKGNVYVLDSGTRKMFCVEAKTGALLNTVKLPGSRSCYASPVAGDGKIYV